MGDEKNEEPATEMTKQQEAELVARIKAFKQTEEFAEAKKAFDDYVAAARELQADVEAAARGAADPENYQASRFYIRAFFALIEGHIWGLKRAALKHAEAAAALEDIFLSATGGVYPGRTYYTPLSGGELALLKNEFFSINNQGEAKPDKQRRLPFELNLKFACRTYAKSWGQEFKLDVQDFKGWTAFKKARNIRNRITHPAHPESLKIKPDERRTINEAVEWFVRNISVLHNMATNNPLFVVELDMPDETPAQPQ